MPRKSKNAAKKQPKKSVDKKQNSRLKKLESFVYKTIENKQVNYNNTNLAVSNSGVRDGQFLSVAPGVNDGAATGDTARIGNTITLMRQKFNFMITQNPTTPIDEWNRMRILIVEALDGNEPILISDVLTYSNYSVYGDLVFSSPRTTKTATNRRYKVHMDKTFELNRRSTGASKVINFDANWKNGKLVEFDNLSATPTNHQMSILFISDSAAVPHPLVNYAVRSTYKDA